MQTIRKLYKQKVYKESTGFLLNLVTLSVSDQEISAKIRKWQYTSFCKILWATSLGALFSMLWHFTLYFSGTGPLFMVIVGAITTLNQTVIVICSRIKPEKSTYFTFSYLLNHVVCTCLFYHGYLGEWEDRTAYQQQIVVNFILVNSVMFNDIKFIVFLQTPLFLAGAYI